MVRGQSETAQRFADPLLDLAERSKDPAELVIAHTKMGINLFWKGDLAIAHDHFERAAERFDPPRQRHLTALFGMDVATDCSGYAALPLWMMGYPDQALQRSERSLSLAQERGHLSTSAMSLCHASVGYLLCRDSRRAQELAQSGLALAEEHGFGLWTALSSIMLGKALAQAGQQAEGIAYLENGVRAARVRGLGPQDTTFGALAEAYGQIAQPTKALELIEEALAAVAKIGMYSIEPELHRITGDLLLLQDPSSLREAERCFRTAIETARRHAAKSWDLRATTSLARLLARKGQRDEALTRLTETYNWFTEGFDTADLKDSKALLDEVSR
jgi:adenylate cyclase